MGESSRLSDIRHGSDNILTKCIHCGHELPAGAAFCPYCETQQTDTVALQAPRRKRKLIIAVIAAMLAAALAIFLAVRSRLPETYEDSKIISYPIKGKTVDVMVSFNLNTAFGEDAVIDKSVKLPRGENGAHPLWLCVDSSDDPSLKDAFAEQIESCSIEAVPVDREASSQHESTPMEISGPQPVEDDSLGPVWYGEVFYTSDNGSNEFRWTIHMKNGDKLLLSQTLTCTELPVVNLHYSTTPLETVDEIKAAIETVSDDTILNLTLPPVTYDEPLILSERTVSLHGTTDSGKTTTFSRTIEIHNRIPAPVNLSGIVFDGDGGNGILAYETVEVNHCTFRGWDVGLNAEEGSWPVIEYCTFEKNKTGLCFNSTTCTASTDGCYQNTFRNNEIGAHIIQVPMDQPFEFVECTFEGNGEDVIK
jgi:hypothetical protein